MKFSEIEARRDQISELRAELERYRRDYIIAYCEVPSMLGGASPHRVGVHAHVDASGSVTVWFMKQEQMDADVTRGARVSDLTPPMLRRLADIVEMIARWKGGELDDLPPSTPWGETWPARGAGADPSP